MAFGYRIFQVGIGKKGKPDVRYDFDNVALHSDGAIGLFRQALTDLVSATDRDDDRLTYFGVDQVSHGGWVFAIQSSGGQFGRARRVRNATTGKEQKPITADDAVLDDLPMVLVVPNHGQQGLLVVGTQGRSHNAFPLERVLEGRWKDRGLVLKLTSDLADSVAWGTYLGQSNLDITHVELTQTAVTPDRPMFGKSSRVSRARVLLTISDANTRKTVLQQVKNAIFNHTGLALTGVLGIEAVSDADVDEYGIVYVKDGREKKLTVSQDYPHFIYPLDGVTLPSAIDLLQEAQSDVEYLMGQMGIAFPATWLPDASSIKTL